MKNFYRAMRIHVSYANVIDYAKKLIEKDMGEEVNIETITFVMAQNTIIDGRKILIALPPSNQLRHLIRKKEVTQNIYIV